MKVVLTNITKRLGIKDCWKTFRYSSIAMGSPQSQWEKMEKSRKIIYVIINARICHYHLRLLEDTQSPAVQAQQRLRERSLGKWWWAGSLFLHTCEATTSELWTTRMFEQGRDMVGTCCGIYTEVCHLLLPEAHPILVGLRGCHSCVGICAVLSK